MIRAGSRLNPGVVSKRCRPAAEMTVLTFNPNSQGFGRQHAGNHPGVPEQDMPQPVTQPDQTDWSIFLISLHYLPATNPGRNNIA